MAPQTGDPAARGVGDAAPPLLVDHRDGASWLRLNRPHRRNALNPQLLSALDEAVHNAAADPQTDVIVITGKGPSFCAGADLEHLYGIAETAGDPLGFLSRVSDCFARIEHVPKPVVAAVHGHVVAGGLELALACDVVIAQSGTLIGDGHVRNGLLPAGGASVRLPRKVGEPLARWLMLTGELMPAEAFVPSGLVRAVAPAEQFRSLITDTVRRLREPDKAAQQRMKQLLHESCEPASRQGLADELARFADHWSRADIAASLTRFLNGSRTA